MRVTYQFDHSYSAQLDVDVIAENLSARSTDAQIDDAIRDDLMEHLQDSMPSPRIHGMAEIRKAVREHIAERGGEE